MEGSEGLGFRSSNRGGLSSICRSHGRQRRRVSLVGFTTFLYYPSGYQILKFFVSTQTQHLFASAGRIPLTKIFVNDLEQLLKLKRLPLRKYGYEFFGDKIRETS